MLLTKPVGEDVDDVAHLPLIIPELLEQLDPPACKIIEL
jgi:hypothetical protein